MEFFIIFLSSLVGLISPAGLVVDRVAENTIRKQVASVEQLQVRIDNTPSYQFLGGRVDRIRIAGRGLFPYKEVRLEALELETDPINVDLRRLQKGKPRLREPLRSGIHLIMREDDINQALQSPAAVNQLRKFGVSVLGNHQARQAQRYELIDPRIELLDNQRLRFQTTLKEARDPATLAIFFESGITVNAGRQIQLVQPIVRLNGEAVPDRVLTGIAAGVAEQLDLRRYEKSGIVARILQFKLDSKQIDVAAFIQVAPDAKLTKASIQTLQKDVQYSDPVWILRKVSNGNLSQKAPHSHK